MSLRSRLCRCHAHCMRLRYGPHALLVGAMLAASSLAPVARADIYVWIDALFNYLTYVDTPERRPYWRSGATHDTLAALHHDPAEYRSLLDPFPREQLPKPYQDAFEGKTTGEITAPFAIDDRSSGLPKFVVAQLVTQTEGGEYTIADLRGTFRDQLAQERAIRRLLDSLRKDVYVSIRM